MLAEMADQDVFASPWKGSDLVLVVEEQELNVHRWILTSQSPVFEAMFKGDYKEASQDRISLEGKDFKSMQQFMKILYPSCMFGEDRAPLDDKSLFSVLQLADEYQCINIAKRCIDEAKITAENVSRMLPYALKYQQSALPEMYVAINRGAPTAKLEKLLPQLDSKETSMKILLKKCRFLEFTVVNMQDAMVSLICNFLSQKKMTDDANQSLADLKKNQPAHSTSLSTYSFGIRSYSGLQPANTFDPTTSKCRFGHTIHVKDINQTRECKNCVRDYKEKFINPIPSYSAAYKEKSDLLIGLLHNGQDVATSVRRK